jgi:tetratricopeptide (TPR) repeat protein
LELNEQIKNKKEIALNLENLGDASQKMGDFENALKYNEKGLALAQSIDLAKRVGYILENMGEIQFHLGNYEKAYEYFNRAIKTAKDIEDKELQILVLVNLSKFFTFLHDDQKAEQLLEEATKIINLINDDRSLIKVYQIKSNLLKKEKKFQEALTLLDQAMDLAEKLSAQEELLSLSLEYSRLYLDWGNMERTNEFLGKASNSGLSRYILFQPEFYLISGKKEWMSGNLSLAQENFEIGLRLAEKLQNPELIWRIHHRLGKLFLSLHHIERAYQELEKAGKILKRVSENIKDDELRQNYLKDQEKKELLSNLKEVAKDLIGGNKDCK